MALSEDELLSKFLHQLSSEERSRAIVYAAAVAVSPGKLPLATSEIDVPWEARLVFVDREPGANWGHSSRYVLLSTKTGEALTIESRFPPFQRNAALEWRTIYKAPLAPDWAVALPEKK